MGVTIVQTQSDKEALPIVAPGRIKLAFTPRSLSSESPVLAGTAPVEAIGVPRTRSGASADIQALCGLIEAVARKEHLPVAFLTRLLWQESSFRSGVISPAGAQGIAQFMPQTAQERGLNDPFDPEKAVNTSASFLSDLTRRFGNLGLAAAAYNGGPARISGWLQGDRTIAAETRAYVLRITGRSVDDWAAEAKSPSPPAEEQQPRSCTQVAGQLGRTS
jgi:hypothetical protein